ncbi:MAG: cytochrome P450 [Propionibacteriaceae bacterium]
MYDQSRTLPFDRPDPLHPPPAYAELREAEPVAAVTTSDGRSAWLVTSYDTVSTVLGDQRFVVTPPGVVAEGATLLQDGEPHQRLRRLVGKAFTPRRVELMRLSVERLADGQADAVVADGAPTDLVAAFAAPLSIAVISELLGVAIEDRDRFRQLADAASKADFLADEAAPATEMGVGAAAAWEAFGGFVAGLVQAKREALADDLLSDLIRARDTDDGRLDDYELTTLVLTILASGYITATNAIAVGATMLLTEGRLAACGMASSAELESTVEEVVRLQIGLIGEVFPRWAREDLELAGVRIAGGDLVLARLGAANRDPARFTDPDALRPDRIDGESRAEQHLAFGRGPHHCLGAALARIEVAAALRALASRLPNLRLDGSVHDIEWIQAHADTGPVAVHLTW